MKKWYRFLIIVLVSLLIEIFLFNNKFFLTLSNHETLIENSNLDRIFEIEDINQNINEIKINVDTTDFTEVKVFARDEGDNNYYEMNSKKVSKSNERSLYQSIHTSGKVKSLKLEVATENSMQFVTGIALNPKVPMMFSFLRFSIITIFIYVLCILSSKEIYKIGLFDDKRNIMYAGIIIMFIWFLSAYLCSNNKYFQTTLLTNHHQYYRLTESLKEGRLYIEEASDFLNEMENPYDKMERLFLAAKTKQKVLWDYAYYNGKYYVYFGVGPVLLMYLPYNLLTGKVLNNVTVNFILTILSSFSLTYLLYVICKKWFQKVKLLTFMLCDLLVVSSCGIFYVVKRPDFYEVPIITALFFSTIGLGLFISATMSEKRFKTKLVLASSCMAFVALCRPQFLISSFLILPLYWEYFFEKMDRKKFKELLCIIIPYLVFAFITCAYNYLRFGNILDFGANYNLTSNDMTRRGFVLARIPLGLFYYLFSSVKMIPVFPYIEESYITSSYFGITIYESMYGGMFFTHMVTALTLFARNVKKYFVDKKLYIFTILSTLFAFIVIIVDTEMAGILPRYFMDFSYLLLLPTVIIIFVLESKILKNKLLRKLLFTLIIMSFIYELLFLFVDVSLSLRELMPNLFYKFYYLFTF